MNRQQFHRVHRHLHGHRWHQTFARSPKTSHHRWGFSLIESRGLKRETEADLAMARRSHRFPHQVGLLLLRGHHRGDHLHRRNHQELGFQRISHSTELSTQRLWRSRIFRSGLTERLMIIWHGLVQKVLRKTMRRACESMSKSGEAFVGILSNTPRTCLLGWRPRLHVAGRRIIGILWHLECLWASKQCWQMCLMEMEMKATWIWSSLHSPVIMAQVRKGRKSFVRQFPQNLVGM